MHMAGDIGVKSSRRVQVQINPVQVYSMFHLSQESSAMLHEHRRRNLACHDQKRRYEMNRSRFFLQRVPRSLPRLPIPRKIKLTMEIQNNDFSSLIGQREAWSANDSVSDIMHDTGCMIQFADQHGIYTNGRITNQAVITGDFPSIDEAQRRLRYLSPVTIALSLKNIKKDLTGKNMTNTLIKWCSDGGELSEFKKIQFNVVLPPQWNSQTQHRGPFLVIRGSYCDQDAILSAADKIYLLLFDLNTKEDFCSRLEIPVLHRRWIVGSPDGVLVRTISMLSACTIHFPLSSHGQTATSYFLSGTAKAVITATKMFYDISPVRMEFDLENNNLARPVLPHNERKREYDHFDTEHNVIVTFRKSHFEGEFRLHDEELRHSISLMTSEENLNNLYAVRRKILKDQVWWEEKTPPKRRTHRPRFIEYLRILITEASVVKSATMSSHNHNDKLSSYRQYHNHHHHNNNNNDGSVVHHQPKNGGTEGRGLGSVSYYNHHQRQGSAQGGGGASNNNHKHNHHNNHYDVKRK